MLHVRLVVVYPADHDGIPSAARSGMRQTVGVAIVPMVHPLSRRLRSGRRLPHLAVAAVANNRRSVFSHHSVHHQAVSKWPGREPGMEGRTVQATRCMKKSLHPAYESTPKTEMSGSP